MNIAQFIAGGWKDDLSTDLKVKEAAAELSKTMAEDETSEDKAIADAYVDGMCEGCGKVAINNGADELCAECQQEYVDNLRDAASGN